ncbi:hypothetical protein DNHGIG_37960 [Collibacillus ludicampi]|jgi:uncharacterized protein YuzB (UPF0349 family)|uniref:DUF1450 domain-containing protein n=1 Tax=Collibacillus ludicampi TaxID=2771369 RepID=A0AAV4LK79_9BACL|nr:DUF1450 domain-containing protein [Collibacillus ludicampi]GIM48247.1 hypothetical protein DNHGIG_37960 [Collibacillus ludicampi]
MSLVVIEVCDINPISSEDLESFERKYNGVTVLRSPCLSHCEICAASPYAYVNGELIIRETIVELMQAIDEAIQSELANWQ